MSTTFTGPVQIYGQDIFTASNIPQHALGERGVTAEGRSFRYCSIEPSATTVTGQVAGATLVAGNLIQTSAPVANHLALTPSVANIGDLTVTVTLGATAAYANQYSQGAILVSVTPGLGQLLKIRSHPAAAASATLVLTLEDPILVALSTSSRIDLMRNIYAGVIQAPATTTGAIIGSAQFAIPALATGGALGQNYGWIQTKGPAAVLSAATIAANIPITGTISAGTAGAAIAASGILQTIGVTLVATASGRTSAVYLMID